MMKVRRYIIDKAYRMLGWMLAKALWMLARIYFNRVHGQKYYKWERIENGSMHEVPYPKHFSLAEFCQYACIDEDKINQIANNSRTLKEQFQQIKEIILSQNLTLGAVNLIDENIVLNNPNFEFNAKYL